MSNHAFVYERNRQPVKRDPLLDVNQVAAKLSVSPRTVYRLIDSGDLLAFRVGTGRSLRIKQSDFDAFKAQREAAEV